MELRDQIVELLKKSEPLKGGEIAEKLGVEKKDVDKAIKALKKEEAVISPKRCFYSVEK